MRARLVFAHDPGPWTGKGSNTWLLPGEVPTLIDTGSGDPRHLDDLAAGLAEEAGDTPLAQVLVTHGHGDHAGGATAVADRWPGATFRKYPWAERDPRYAVRWQPLRDDELISAGDEPLWVVHTPGHSPDHVCFFEPRSGTLFAGDLVMNGATIVIPASHGGSLSQYLQSLRRVLDLAPRRILAGHGPAVEQPAALIRAYIAHRLAREEQILAALGKGPATIAELVAQVYPTLQEELAPAAGESVLAHLRKLEEEGRVRAEDAEAPAGARWRRQGS